MTLDQADAARRRAVIMLERFGDSGGAAEFEAMTPEGYADHKGIVVENPSRFYKLAQHITARGKPFFTMTSEVGSGRDEYKFDAVGGLGVRYPWLTVYANSEVEAWKIARREAREQGVDNYVLDETKVNPSNSKRRKTMADKKIKTELEEAHDALRDIYDTVQEAGTTRAEMQGALDKISALCTDTIPDLDEDDEDETDDDGEGDDDDDGEGDDDDEGE